MSLEEKIDELYERIFDLNAKIIEKDNTMEFIRDRLLHSHLTIDECEYVLTFLNKALGDE